MRCHGCGREVALEGRVQRQDTCPGCGRPLHACRNCSLFDPRASNQCREPQAEWVSDRAAANFCEWFRPGTGAVGAGPDQAGQARRKLDDLFRKRQ